VSGFFVKNLQIFVLQDKLSKPTFPNVVPAKAGI
jgi:hypothetical protein